MWTKRNTKFAFVLVAFLIPVFVAEILLRYFVSFPLVFREENFEQIESATLLHEPSEIAGLDFQLAPSREEYAFGTIVRTNRFGMRDKSTSLVSREGDLRVAVVGDSFTFGWGVLREDAYPSQLERLLNEPGGNKARYEVLNFGVASYSIHDEALLIEHRVLEWRPDVLVVGYFLNDPEITPIQPLNMYFYRRPWWLRLHLSQLVWRAHFLWDLERLAGGSYFHYLHLENREPWRATVQSMRRIRKLVRPELVRLILVILPRPPSSSTWEDYPFRSIHERVAKAASAEGIAVFDTLSDFAEYEPSSVRVSREDRHFSPLGHFVVARRLKTIIETQD